MEDREPGKDTKEFLERRIARLEHQAEAHASLGEYPRSIELLEEACRLSRIWFGDRLSSAVPRLQLLAEQYRRIGEGAQAELRSRRLAALESSTEDLEAMRYARTLNSLGVLRCESGQHEGALQPLAQALEIARRHHGEDGSAVAVLAANLAGACHVLGKHRQAEALYLEALSILECGPRRDAPEVLYCLCSLAELCILNGRQEGAHELLRRALKIARRGPHLDLEGLAEGLARLADLYYRLGEPDRALTLVRESARKLEEAGRLPVAELRGCLERLARLKEGARSQTDADGPDRGRSAEGEDP